MCQEKQESDWGIVDMMKRKVHPARFHLILNVLLLIFVAALLVFAVMLVRIKMLQNAQSLGMALVHSYALEEEMNVSSLETHFEIAVEYLDEMIAAGDDKDEIQAWLRSYIGKFTDAVGSDVADFYAVVNGQIIASNPWEGDKSYPYPAAVEDAYEVVRWFAQHPDRYSIDPEQMVVMGYSAGANLATVCAMLSKERGEFALKGQILCYPYLDSVHQPGEKPHFAADMDQEVMEAFVQLYCTQAQRTDPHVSPVCATLEQLRGLCPALVLLAEWDALRQEGEHYVRMLQEAGVDTEYRVLNQTHHGFLEDWANRPCYEALPADVREKHDPAFQQAAQWAVTILERFVRRICQPEGPTDNTKD